jgi:dihydrofolate reductase
VLLSLRILLSSCIFVRLSLVWTGAFRRIIFQETSMSRIFVIAAISRNGVYGDSGVIPWFAIKEELQHFKSETTGHVVVMGRATWESLPVKTRPLHARMNVVVSANPNYQARGAIVVPTLEQAIEAPAEHGIMLCGSKVVKAYHTDTKVFVIGGVSLWCAAMEYADEVILSVVNQDYSITVGQTCVATNFLRMKEQYPDFLLKEHTHIKPADPSAPEFEIQRWERI